MPKSEFREKFKYYGTGIREFVRREKIKNLCKISLKQYRNICFQAKHATSILENIFHYLE